MEQEAFEAALRQSAHLKQSLAGLLHSTEAAVTLIALAASRQLDAARLEADLLWLQSEAAAEGADPARDHILDHLRQRLRAQR